MSFCRNKGETTTKWLERLIQLDAPTDIRGDVREILATETASGIYYIY
jgi:hypothetical protein